MVLNTDGTLGVSAGITVTLDGVSTPSGTSYPVDGLEHTIVVSVTSAGTAIGYLAQRFNNTSRYAGRIYDFSISRANTVRYNLPLVGDTVEGTNLLRDSEFTSPSNWTVVTGMTVRNNSLVLNNSITPNSVESTTVSRDSTGTYRYLFNYNITAGSVSALAQNIGLVGDPVTGTGFV